MTRILLIIGATCAVVFVAIASPPDAIPAELSVQRSTDNVAQHRVTAPNTAVHGLQNAEVKPCARTEFKTKMVKDACAAGGQKAAKKALKTWMKANKAAYKEKYGKSMTCKTCHTKFGGDFPLNADGVRLYKEFGGK
ncbi:MAG: hypothetical protein VX223_05205 [Myxococcota bacterium]|nr:hypothetical protein [Myxococcota bacterium]